MALLHNSLLLMQWLFLVFGLVGFLTLGFVDNFTWYHSMLSGVLCLLALISLKIEVVSFAR